MKIKRLFSLFAAFVIIVCSLLNPINTKVDALGVKSNGNGGRTDVGAWFVTYNTSGMWSNNFGTGFPIRYRMLMPDGKYGIPDSYNTEIIDFQLKELADAKVDFILFDLTNGGLTEKIHYGYPDNYWITETAQLTCERIAIWNKSHDWKIRYAVAVGTYDAIRTVGQEPMTIGQVTEYQAEAVLDLFYHKYGEDNYYQLKGKPLLVIHDFGHENDVNAPGGWKMYRASSTTDHDAGEQFIIRGSLTSPNEKTGFSWLTPRESGTFITDESATVCPGQWNHTSTSPGVPRLNGQHYIDDWDKVVNYYIAPDIVLISSWNDFNEDTAVFTADSSNCNEKWEEQWKDDTGSINNTMYLQITKEGIWRLRTNNGDKIDDLDDMLKDNDRIWLKNEKSDEQISKLVKTASKYKQADAAKNATVIFEGNINPWAVAIIFASFSFVVIIAAVIILFLNLRSPKKKNR